MRSCSVRPRRLYLSTIVMIATVGLLSKTAAIMLVRPQDAVGTRLHKAEMTEIPSRDPYDSVASSPVPNSYSYTPNIGSAIRIQDIIRAIQRKIILVLPLYIVGWLD